MKKLTKAEEEIMQILWEIGEGPVGDIRDRLAAKAGGKMPAHSTVSTMMKVLLDKGYIDYKAYGRTFVYRPILTKDDYSKQSLRKLVRDYFGGSANRLVSFLVKEEDLSIDELNSLLDQLEEDETDQNS